MDLRHSGRKRKRKQESSQSHVLVHRGTLQFVLERLVSPPQAGAAYSPDSEASHGDDFAPDTADHISGEGHLACHYGGFSDHGPMPDGHPATMEEDGNDSAFVDGELLVESRPEMDNDDPAPSSRPKSRSLSVSARPSQRRSRQSCRHRVRRGPPKVAPLLQMDRQLHRAAQHAVSSGDRRDRLEAFQAACLLLPRAPRLSWQLAVSVCVSRGLADPAEVAQLHSITEHFLCHAGLDRPSVRLVALGALTAAGQPTTALETSSAGRRSRVVPSQAGRLLGAVQEWVRYVQAPPGETRRLHLQTLYNCLGTLTAEDEGLRPSLEPLLRSISGKSEHDR